MKALRIEFVRDTHWRWVWMATMVCGMGMIALFTWRHLALQQEALQNTEQIHTLQLQLQKLRTPEPIKADPRRASIDQATQFLRVDANRVFATPENLDIAGVKLRYLSFENTSGTIKLEYELDSLDRAAAITEALNGGYDARPWRLENVNASNSNQVLGAAASILSAQQFRGMWSARLNSL
jgi:hypothetical protein